MADFMDSDDRKSMRVTGRQMNQIGSMVEAVITQGEMLKDHKREIANLKQSSVHLQGIAKKRRWLLPKPETDKAT